MLKLTKTVISGVAFLIGIILAYRIIDSLIRHGCIWTPAYPAGPVPTYQVFVLVFLAIWMLITGGILLVRKG